MAVDYFETELKRARERFNETFGQQTICNLKTRQLAILAIVAMSLLAEKIAEARQKDHVREEIRRFMKARTLLRGLFSQFNPYTQERRNHGHCPIDQKEIPCVASPAGG